MVSRQRDRSITKSSMEDRSFMYKSKPRGVADKLVREFRFQKERKQNRSVDIGKRRRMPLTPLQMGNQEANVKEPLEEKVTTSKDEKAAEKTGTRRDRLIKWKEEKLLRKKQQEKTQKKVFAVRHVASSSYPSFSSLSKTAAVKKAQTTTNGTKCVPSNACAAPPHPVTRSSARKLEPATNKKKTAKPISTNRNKQMETNTKKPTKPYSGMKTRSKTKAETKTVEDMSNQTIEPEPVEKTSTMSRKDSQIQDHQQEKMNSDNERVGDRSFAPNDFSFKAPTGVDSFYWLGKFFKFQPISPFSADRFIFPNASENATESLKEEYKENEVEMQEKENQSNCIQEANQDNSGTSKRNGESIYVEGNVIDNNEHIDTKDICENDKLDKKVGSSHNVEKKVRDDSGELGSDLDVEKVCEHEEVNSAYFRNLVETETRRMQDLCALWEEQMNGKNELPEEVEGLIRTVVGQVQLLVTKKFRQFKGLIDASEDPNAERKTRNSDLQGFWDMMYFQVEDIDAKFKKLEKLKLNHWEEEKVEVKKVSKGRTGKKVVKKPRKVKGKVAESRNKLRQMKAIMKAKLKAQEKTNQTPVKNVSTQMEQDENETCVFDSKYFQPSSSCFLKEHVEGTPNSFMHTPVATNHSQDATPAGPGQSLLVNPVVLGQSDLDTPTPSKRTNTPMPDTAFTTSLDKETAKEKSSGHAVATGAQSVTSCTLLANFHLNDSNSEVSGLFNESVFFPKEKPCTQSPVEDNPPPANLIFFSPTTPLKKGKKEETSCGSVRRFAPVRPSKTLEAELGTDTIYSPVRRSARIEANPTMTLTRPALASLSPLPDDVNFGYVPNMALFKAQK